jgi:stage II sporulation protein D
MPRRLSALLVVPFVLAGAALAQPRQESPTVGTTTFVVNGHGWGHAIGMGQWGADGMALKGKTFDQILAYYYRGTQLGQAPLTKLRVLLAQGKKVTVSSDADFSVQDAAGVVHPLPAGSYTLGTDFSLVVDALKPPVALQGPVTFVPRTAPLELGSKPYRGQLQVQLVGKRLQAVNIVGLEAYARGVVTQEMPKAWPLAALEAQAVAARSYAVAVRQQGAILYPDQRSQVYGGLDAETPSGTQAVTKSKGQVVLYGGKVAMTWYFSSSGGRTVSYSDVYPDRPPIPYLVSVRDPYDVVSPYHNWGPVVFTAADISKLLHAPGVTDFVPSPSKGRATEVIVTGQNGDVTLPAATVRSTLGLRSTWISTAVLSLARPRGRATAGASVTLTGLVERDKDPVTLQERTAGGAWEAGPPVAPDSDGKFTVVVSPTITTQYRLVAGKVKTKALLLPVVAAGS